MGSGGGGSCQGSVRPLLEEAEAWPRLYRGHGRRVKSRPTRSALRAQHNLALISRRAVRETRLASLTDSCKLGGTRTAAIGLEHKGRKEPEQDQQRHCGSHDDCKIR